MPAQIEPLIVANHDESCTLPIAPVEEGETDIENEDFFDDDPENSIVDGVRQFFRKHPVRFVTQPVERQNAKISYFSSNDTEDVFSLTDLFLIALISVVAQGLFLWLTVLAWREEWYAFFRYTLPIAFVYIWYMVLGVFFGNFEALLLAERKTPTETVAWLEKVYASPVKETLYGSKFHNERYLYEWTEIDGDNIHSQHSEMRTRVVLDWEGVEDLNVEAQEDESQALPPDVAMFSLVRMKITFSSKLTGEASIENCKEHRLAFERKHGPLGDTDGPSGECSNRVEHFSCGVKQQVDNRFELTYDYGDFQVRRLRIFGSFVMVADQPIVLHPLFYYGLPLLGLSWFYAIWLQMASRECVVNVCKKLTVGPPPYHNR
jgi:hypothetical protein